MVLSLLGKRKRWTSCFNKEFDDNDLWRSVENLMMIPEEVLKS